SSLRPPTRPHRTAPRRTRGDSRGSRVQAQSMPPSTLPATRSVAADDGDDGRAVRTAARRRAAVSGVLSAGLTLGVAQLVAGFVSPGSAPLAAIGDGFIDVVPGWLKDLAIGVFGVHDKTALLVGMSVVLVVVAAGAGRLADRSSA